eukprot:scaffold682254_cov74-Prasinocladus_malaysianus.AAC.1
MTVLLTARHVIIDPPIIQKASRLPLHAWTVQRHGVNLEAEILSHMAALLAMDFNATGSIELEQCKLQALAKQNCRMHHH